MCLGATHAETSWRDIETRIQYGYYTEDAAALRSLENTVAADESHDKLHGYYAGKADAPAVIDFDKFTKDAEKLGKYCGNNPTHGLITAADKTLAED